jgi:N-acetyl sugar amidotransferase
MRRCTKCLIPETQETIIFDEEGVCNVCKQIEFKKDEIDWKSKEKSLLKLINQYKDKSLYDCIIPFSGGKDSTFTVYILVKKYGLKPLLVSFDHGFFRPTVLKNRERTIKKLGVDCLTFKPNWKVVKKLMLESLMRKGDFCWHCHTGIFAYPMQIAVNFQIPLLFWGEPSAEYAAYYSYDQPEEVDERRFNRFVNLGITAEDMVGMLDESVTLRDLEPFRYPKLKDLRDLNYRSVCLGSYIPWNAKKQVEIIKKELGWRGEKVEGVPERYDYDKIECAVIGVRDYLKFIKRGFGRTAWLASLDIRNGRLTREEGMKLMELYDGKRPASLDYFLEIIGIREEEFMEIALKHVVSPHVHDPSKVKRGDELWDQKMWDEC